MSESIAAGLISGGLDSTVLAAHMQVEYDESIFVFCDYGQKTMERERRAFEELCGRYNPARAEVVDLTWMSHATSSGLFSRGVKLDQTNLEMQYVPFRNAILLSAAVAIAETALARSVLLGSNAEDATCPDNSPAFIAAFQKVVDIGTMTDQPIGVEAPLVNMNKRQIISYGNSIGAPFELSWSCHNNATDIACGGCSNCVARRNAFSDLGLVDPLAYAEEAVDD